MARVVVLVALGQVVMDLVLVTMCKQSQHIVCPYPKRLTISYYFMPPVTTLTLGHPPFTILYDFIGDRLKKEVGAGGNIDEYSVLRSMASSSTYNLAKDEDIENKL